MNKERSLSQYQDGYNMYYSEKEAFKQLPEASHWPISGAGEYDRMELIDYIDGLFIDIPSIQDYWITARLNTAFKGHAIIWYTEMKEIHGRKNWPWWKSQIIKKSINDPYEWCLRQSKRLKAIDPQMNIQVRNHKLLTQIQGELEHAVKFRCNHNCTLDDIENTSQDAKKEVYAIEKVPEEESPTEDSDSDSMGDAIREQSEEEKDPREEFLGEAQEETPLEKQDIQLEAGMPQDTSNKNLCKHTQHAQTSLVTPTIGMAYIH
ncbi:hypothetical protein O181_018834 [Austropuccinia psidii MF-1]|uniref:Uncharacterized protein n=1 Tax=Austropuccinia psidii MF-1 TaxID=1389203 RepID=A0A9Q3C8E5_9BASI|nr:hypothetical protein [Austropuccinia psidii MF-1]